ncbi:MAG: PDZ domain-containing protein [Calditrichia bacterium]
MSEHNVNGVVVTQIDSNSEAETVGLKIGDIILTYDGLFLNGDVGYLKTLFENNKDRAEINLTIIRDSEQINLSVKGGDLGINGVGSESSHSFETPLPENGSEEVNAEEGMTSDEWVCSFFCVPYGIYKYFDWQKSYPKKASQVCTFYIVLFVINILIRLLMLR